jgi:hypothetical protein
MDAEDAEGRRVSLLLARSRALLDAAVRGGRTRDVIACLPAEGGHTSLRSPPPIVDGSHSVAASSYAVSAGAPHSPGPQLQAAVLLAEAGRVSPGDSPRRRRLGSPIRSSVSSASSPYSAGERDGRAAARRSDAGTDDGASVDRALRRVDSASLAEAARWRLGLRETHGGEASSPAPQRSVSGRGGPLCVPGSLLHASAGASPAGRRRGGGVAGLASSGGSSDPAGGSAAMSFFSDAVTEHGLPAPAAVASEWGSGPASATLYRRGTTVRDRELFASGGGSGGSGTVVGSDGDGTAAAPTSPLRRSGSGLGSGLAQRATAASAARASPHQARERAQFAAAAVPRVSVDLEL